MFPISVIILNWNGVRLLREYLPSVIKYTNPELAEVIVADNGSSDESLQVLKEEFPEVKIVELSQNYGYARGYNLAIATTDSPYVVLLNDDVRVTEGWLEPMYEYMQAHPEVSAVQPKILSDRDPKMFEYAGAAGGFLDKHGYPYCRGRVFEKIEEDHGQYDDTKKVMWATGACLMVRTDTFYKAGSLDQHFFAHMEEIDLCWRMRNLGYEIVCLPASKVYHYGGASLAAENPMKTKLNFRNSLLMLYKNLPTEERKSMMRTRKILDGVAAVNFLLHFQFAHVAAIWTAHREAKKMIKTIYFNVVPPKTNSNKEFPENRRNILWSKLSK